MTRRRLPGPPFSGRPRAKLAAFSRLHSFIQLHHTADCTFLQVREILFAKFCAAHGVVTNVIVLQAAQLNTAYFSGNRLWHLGHELEPPDPLDWREPRV